MSEYDNYDDYTDPEEENGYDAIYGTKKITPWKIIKKAVKYFFILIGVTVFVSLLLRIFIAGDTNFSKAFLWTERSITAYNENPESFDVYYYKRPDNISLDGKFSASSVYFIPSISQIQLTVRYNNSTIDKLIKDYNLEKTPTGELFVFTLSDNLGNVYTEYTYTEDKMNMYNYRRVVFESVDMNATKTVEEDGIQTEKKFEELTINIYYKDEVLLSEPYSKMTVYDANFYHEPFDFSKYIPKDNKPSELKKHIEYTVKEEQTETDTIE